MNKINGDWFRTKLTQKGRSQREMAKHMGIDPSSLTLTLNAKRKMQLPEAQAISVFLGEPITDILRAAGLPMGRTGESAKQSPPLTGTPVEGLKQKRDQLLAEVDALNKAIKILEK
jgi:transcriptional regulator with XRE-family HTH domain